MSKKILCFIDWYRPGFKAGGTITAFGNFVDHLESFFEFYIIARDTDYCEKEPYTTIKSGEWNKLSKSMVYYLPKYDICFKRINRISKTIPYDYIYINGIFSLFFSLVPLLLFRKSKLIINPHGMLSEQAFSVKKIKKQLLLLVLNFLRIYKYATFHVANQQEADAVKKRIRVFKDIKIAAQLPRKILTANYYKPRKKISNELRLISIARISPEKGTKYIFNFLSHIKEGNITVDMYGQIYDKEYWEECQLEQQKLSPNIIVNYKGNANSHNIPDILSAYHFLIMPSEGENFGHAIIEALSCGCPVIIGDCTPWRNLEKKNIGWDIPLNKPDNFSEVIKIALSMDQDIYNKYSTNAFNYAKEYNRNKKNLEINKKIFI